MLEVTQRDRVAWVIIDRPPANALSNELLRRLVGGLTELAADDAVRGLVLTATGSRFFCAGGDVKEFGSAEVEAGRERARLGSRLKTALDAVPCPLVCAVNGAAIGSGMEMAAFADYCVASTTARFGMPEINHGLLPMAKGIQQLVKVIGYQNTKAALFSGAIFDVQRAAAYGLVHEVVDGDELWDRADSWVTAMADKPPELFRALKRTIARSPFLDDDALERMTEQDLLGYFGAEESRSSLSSLIGTVESSAEPLTHSGD